MVNRFSTEFFHRQKKGAMEWRKLVEVILVLALFALVFLLIWKASQGWVKL